MTATAVLTDDVEDTLRKAIDQANNVSEKPEKKSRKRKRTTADGEGSLPKKKKDKSRAKEDDELEDDDNDEGVVVAGSSVTTYTQETRAPPPSPKQKPKKKKKQATNNQTSKSATDTSNIRSSLPTDELAAALTNNETGRSHQDLTDLLRDSEDSSENLLRVLTELDMPKIASVLKDLGVDASEINAIGAAAVPRRVKEAVAKSATAAAKPARATASFPRPLAKKFTQDSDYQRGADYGEHSHTLAWKWLDSSKLNKMEREEGLVYRKGKFSSIEEDQLGNAVDSYRLAHGLSEDEMRTIIKKSRTARGGGSDKSLGAHESFWFEITSQVPLRPVIAVYHHVRRKYDVRRAQGKWVPEEDTVLDNAVIELGPRWEAVSERVGRPAGDCRDRWRNYIKYQDRNTGAWSKEEEEQLIRIVQGMTVNKGLSADGDVFWTQVSQEMGGKRTRQQCRIKWYDSINGKIKNKGEQPRWSPQDAFILVYKIASLNVNDDSEIDWKNLSDPDWNFYGAHTLQRRWRGLKNAVNGHETMPFQELLEILKAKKGSQPDEIELEGPTKEIQAGKRSPRKKALTAKTVAEDDDEVSSLSEVEDA